MVYTWCSQTLLFPVWHLTLPPLFAALCTAALALQHLAALVGWDLQQLCTFNFRNLSGEVTAISHHTSFFLHTNTVFMGQQIACNALSICVCVSAQSAYLSNISTFCTSVQYQLCLLFYKMYTLYVKQSVFTIFVIHS